MGPYAARQQPFAGPQGCCLPGGGSRPAAGGPLPTQGITSAPPPATCSATVTPELKRVFKVGSPQVNLCFNSISRKLQYTCNTRSVMAVKGRSFDLCVQEPALTYHHQKVKQRPLMSSCLILSDASVAPSVMCSATTTSQVRLQLTPSHGSTTTCASAAFSATCDRTAIFSQSSCPLRHTDV